VTDASDLASERAKKKHAATSIDNVNFIKD